MILCYDIFDSFIGVFIVVGDSCGIYYIFFENNWYDVKGCEYWQCDVYVVCEVCLQLLQYLCGECIVFVLLFVLYGMLFQLCVWWVLVDILFGWIWSYVDFVCYIDYFIVSWVVGVVNGCNLLLIVLFCYWVIGSNGVLIGFGGGLDIKVVLLQLEVWCDLLFV